jgi:hypothetical protein
LVAERGKIEFGGVTDNTLDGGFRCPSSLDEHDEGQDKNDGIVGARCDRSRVRSIVDCRMGRWCDKVQ